MIEIQKGLLKEIYNELVCCRRLREEELQEYIKNNSDEDINPTQIEIFEENIKYTKYLCDCIRVKI